MTYLIQSIISRVKTHKKAVFMEVVLVMVVIVKDRIDSTNYIG